MSTHQGEPVGDLAVTGSAANGISPSEPVQSSPEVSSPSDPAPSLPSPEPGRPSPDLNYYGLPITPPEYFDGEHAANALAAGLPPVCSCGWTPHGRFTMADHLRDMGL